MQNSMPSGRLSVPELRSLAHLLSADELRSVDTQKLPLCIPTELIEEVARDKQSIIEDFIFEVSVHGIELEKMFGPKIHQVLTAASATKDSHAYTALSQQVDKMRSTYKKIQTDFELGLINHFYHIKKAALEWIKELKMELAYVQNLLDFTLEQQPTANPSYADALDVPAKSLQNRTADIQSLINSYNQVCLSVMGQHMHHILQHVKANEEHHSSIMQQVERDRAELEELHNNVLTRHAKSSTINALKSDIRKLMEQAQTYESIISEDQIFEWLDAYVEMLLDKHESSSSEKYLRQVRVTLFSLLTEYCNHQENGARQAARNPFTQTDTKKLISFMLRSERFVLDYFNQKKNEISSWLGDMAHSRLQRLEQVEHSILKELRQNRKLN